MNGSGTGEKVCYTLRLEFSTSNNEAEYETLIVRLRLAKEIGIEQVKIYNDFQLVVNQVNRDY